MPYFISQAIVIYGVKYHRNSASHEVFNLNKTMKKEKANSIIEPYISLREESAQILGQLLDRVALIALTLGTLAVIGSAFRASTQGWHTNIIVDIVFFIIVVILLLFRKVLPFTLVAALLLIISGLNAFISFINLGLATVSFVILTACIVLASIFFGFRVGLQALIASIVIVGGIGFFVSTDRLKTIDNLDFYLLSPQTWITQLTGFTVFVLIILASIHSIQQRLWQSIVELKHKSSEVNEREERYRLLAENMRDVMFIQDIHLNFLYLSPSVEDMFGYSVAELMKLKLNDILTPASLKQAINRFSQYADMAKTSEVEMPLMEFEYVKKDGSKFWGELKPTFLRDDQNKIYGLQGIIRDISERKKAEIQIQKDLEEKKTLLQEIHHRVKNNLNVITSLLSLQASNIKADPEILKAFKESKDRIHAMALVHEKLYQSKDYERIDIKSYVEIMTKELFQAYCARDDVILNLNIQNITLDINTAIPCGLILNELITNTMKYAFPKKRAGQIDVSFNKSDDSHYKLMVSDTGIGLSKDVSLSKSLGLQLVNILTEQLDGSIKIDRHPGTTFTITFPAKKG